MADNMVVEIGNLTKDVELRYTSSGTAIASASVAVNKRWQNKTTQEWEEETSFFNLVMFRELGENAAESFHKGDRVIVVGQMRQRSWETDEGDKRSTVEIVVDDIGPSCRWATIGQIERTRKAGGGGAPSTGGGGGRSDVPPAYEDEEPW